MSNPPSNFSTSTPLVIAHRGASGAAVENSIEAFRLAVEMGADGVELDIHSLADGGLLVHHDPELRALGPIARLTTTEARSTRLADGTPPPLLQEALDVLKGLHVWVEVKSLAPEWDRALLDALSRGPEPASYAVHSFDHRIIARLARAEPRLRCGLLSASYPIHPLDIFDDIPAARTLWQQTELIDEALVDTAKANGIEVIAWTVNSDAEARRLARLGVAALCGNHPDRLLATIPRAR
jgi:glycerophosphoryl diester phosphodiesterase